MRILDIIEKKKLGEELSKEEISFWIKGLCSGDIPDYQTSALLMAIRLKGMNQEETVNLCQEMVHSGDILDLSEIEGIKADKHSTGGVGDKTSLVLGPLVASCGLKICFRNIKKVVDKRRKRWYISQALERAGRSFPKE